MKKNKSIIIMFLILSLVMILVGCKQDVAESIKSVTGISVSKTVTIEQGQTVALNAVITPENASDKTVEWTTDDSSVVELINQSGVVKGAKAGIATVTVKSKSSPDKTAQCMVIVKTGYLLRYLKENGEDYEPVESYNFDDAVTIRAGEEKTGYTLTGWQDTTDSKIYQPGTTIRMPNRTVVLAPVYEAGTISVHYVENKDSLQDLSVSHPGDKPATYGQEFGTEVAAELTDGNSKYNFVGWFLANGTQVTSSDKVETTDDITLYAKWISVDKFYVQYHRNTSSSDTKVKQSAESWHATPITVASQSSFTRLGYTFAKWNTQADGTGTDKNNGDSVSYDSSTAVKGAMNLYAQWTANTYTVSFDKNGGDGTMQADNHNLDNRNSLTANAFTRTGYEFAGWNTKADGSGVLWADGQTFGEDLIPSTGTSITLYAQWNIKTYTITYDYNGGSLPAGQTNKTGFTINSSFNLNSPEKTNYAFKGWNTKSDGTGTQYSQISGMHEDLTLYAIWEGNSYTINFAKNHNASSTLFEPQTINSISAKFGEDIILPAGFKYKGTEVYNFVGWAVETTSIDRVFSVGKKLTDEDRAMIEAKVIGGSVILNAIWTDNTAIVYYKAIVNGVETSVTETSGNIGDSYKVSTTVNVPTDLYVGYEPNGWKDSNGTVITSISSLAATNYLYVNWKPITFTVQYISDNDHISNVGTQQISLSDNTDLTSNESGEFGFIGIYTGREQTGTRVKKASDVIGTGKAINTNVDASSAVYTLYSHKAVGTMAVDSSAGRPNNQCEWVQLWQKGPKFAKFNVGSTITDYSQATQTSNGQQGKNNPLYCTANVGGLYGWCGKNDVRTGNTGDRKTVNDTATAIWGVNWRMPVADEAIALTKNCTWTWVTNGYGNLVGCKVTGKGDYASYSIFLPCSGYFCPSLDYQGAKGRFWTTTKGTYAKWKISLCYYKNYAGIDNLQIEYYVPVRAIVNY